MEEDTAILCEVKALRIEMKHFTELVEKLSKEFIEMKRELETTRCALSEITMQLLSTN